MAVIKVFFLAPAKVGEFMLESEGEGIEGMSF
jgi:hypothetical protein